MIIFFLIVIGCISIGLNIAAFILIKNLLHKISIYEEWILEFKSDVIHTLETLRNLDKEGVFSSVVNDKGLFESDDQVGMIFKEMLAIIEKLNQRTK